MKGKEKTENVSTAFSNDTLINLANVIFLLDLNICGGGLQFIVPFVFCFYLYYYYVHTYITFTFFFIR